ncbi:MAG TPA: transglutaminase domain-containing protein [Myxococcaceae bacterium]|nr:transglutaminase domain-containing protein [Myxococcaceae bacterium]
MEVGRVKIALALTLLALNGAERRSYWFELWGVPVGVVVLERGPAELTYRSRLVFTRGADKTSVQRSARLRVDGEGRLASGEAPESLWLSWRPKAVGCQRVVEELGGRTGEACVRRREGLSDVGMVLGAEYLARYDDGGALVELRIGESRFVRLEGPAHALDPPDLFGDGLPVGTGPGPLRLEPAVAAPSTAVMLKPEWTEAEARSRSEAVHGRFAEKRPSGADFGGAPSDAAGCLGHARAFLAEAKGRSAVMVQGLLVDPGGARAYPHVWVRVRLQSGALLDLDPTSLDEVTRATHLALAAGASPEDAGALWLEVLRGGHRVVRGAR